MCFVVKYFRRNELSFRVMLYTALYVQSTRIFGGFPQEIVMIYKKKIINRYSIVRKIIRSEYFCASLFL